MRLHDQGSGKNKWTTRGLGISNVAVPSRLVVSASLTITAIFVFLGPAVATPVPADDKSLVNQIHLSVAELFPARVYLVKLEVVDVAIEMLARTTFRVLHVYVGPAKLKGSRIETPLFGHRENLAGGSPFAGGRGILRRGDIGLFVVVEKNAPKGISVLSPPGAAEFNVRAVINESKHFNRCVELAELAQQFYEATDGTRLRKIDDALKCPDVAKASLAFWYLKQAKNPELLEYMLQLSRDSSLPIEVQMDLNDFLRERKKDWAGSHAELEMVARWFTDRWKGTLYPRDYVGVEHNPPLYYYNPTEEESLAGWFANAAADKWYSAAQLVDLTVKGIANPKRSSVFKEKIKERLKDSGVITREAKDRSEGFSQLVRQIKQSPGVAEKDAAAKLLDIFASLDAGQRRELQALLAVTREESVADQLRSILDEK